MLSYEIIFTRPCIYCGDTGMVTAKTEQVLKYIEGAHVQDAFPEMDVSLREQIISGIHPDCWNKLFPTHEETAEIGASYEL